MFCTKPISYTLNSLSFILINGLTSSSHAMISFSFTPYVVSQQTLLFYFYNVSLSVPTTQVLILSLGLYSFPTVLPATNHNLHIITRLNFPTVWLWFVCRFSDRSPFYWEGTGSLERLNELLDFIEIIYLISASFCQSLRVTYLK